MNSHQRRILRRSLGDMPRLPNNALFISSEAIEMARRTNGTFGKLAVPYVQTYGRAVRPVKPDAEVDAMVAVLRANPPVEIKTMPVFEIHSRVSQLKDDTRELGLGLSERINGHLVYTKINKANAVTFYVDDVRTAYEDVAGVVFKQ